MNCIESKFSFFGLNNNIIKSLNDMNYIQPSPIQKICIPLLLNGFDVLGMAQTGSGKTAAFALPLLNNINLLLKFPQILVLTPTRELAIQVSVAFSDFSKYIKNINILALYGGQRYDLQLKSLRFGPQIVVGTPGRLLDHLNRGTLNLSKLNSLVLDEADEMLRMGFIEDVKNIMKKIPSKHQTALFSATMPNIIKKIAHEFMVKPKEIFIKSNITTRPNIKQNYWLVCIKKKDALIRFLEVEVFSAVIIFVRTKNSTLKVSEILERNGYNSAALNGDMNQILREQTLEKFKNGYLDILIATDVAARGLDVDRISLVINYDIPMDVESYVHRIGRTGRAGRTGKALLFVERRELRLLKNIEKIIKSKIIEIKLPNMKILSLCRLKKFSIKVKKKLKSNNLNKYLFLFKKLQFIHNLNSEILSSVLLKIAQGKRSLIISKKNIHNNSLLYSKNKNINNKNIRYFSKYSKNINNMDVYKINLGKNDCVEVKNIVGAISNEGRIDSKKIGIVKIFSSYSTIELPKEYFYIIKKNLIKTRIFNKFINLRILNRENLNKNYLINKYKFNYKKNKLNKKKIIIR